MAGSSNIETASASITERLKTAVRRRRYAALLSYVEFLTRRGRTQQARDLIIRSERRLVNNRRTRNLLNTIFSGHPGTAKIAEIRGKDLIDKLKRPIERRNFTRILELVTEFEALNKSVPRVVGDMLATELSTTKGRQLLKDAARESLKNAPLSPFLIYLSSSLRAKNGDFEDASRFVRSAMDTLAAQTHTTDAESAQAKKTFSALSNNWRVIDQIAREQMGWSAAADNESETNKRAKSNGTQELEFKEPLLQARDEDGYLKACLSDFDKATTLLNQVKTIADMLRQSTRRQFTYHKAYAQANTCIDTLQGALAELTNLADVAALKEADAIRIVQTLARALWVYRTLERSDDVETLKQQLLSFGRQKPDVSAMWLLLPELVLEDDETWRAHAMELRKTLPLLPAKEHQLKAYLRWALWARTFEEADKVFFKMPRPLREGMSALYYVNILQRESRFKEALEVLSGIHTKILSQPARVNPLQHWNLMRRQGELKFLSETADAFARVPLSSAPKGVVVVGARNLDQLRKYPLVVLMELRRQGWAVISLVEGLLPQEKTGVREVDLLNGCITIERRLSPEAAKVFPELKDFVAAPEKGRVDWMGLNLTHSLLEDARINRRAYDVDFSCPALTGTLSRLCEWTELFARATVFANDALGRQKIRCGLISLFNSRLPDTVFRLYCDKAGDPYEFFALQTANGYENYFANFGNEISTRCVIRNVTRFSEVRSASFPRPTFFESYYKVNEAKTEEVLERVEHIATAKRTSGPAVTTIDPEAAACEERIHAWREKGGKVACLFGRVVCDSAVPFDGGPVHDDFKKWLWSSIDAVRGSDTMLLIKPHPHEMNEQIATYLNQYFFDLLPEDLPDNVVLLGHRWFDITALARFTDLGLIYNGTVAVEMALLNIPCIQANHFGPIDYPLGHYAPKSPEHYRAMLRFEEPVLPDPEMRPRAAMWLDYMSNGRFALDYRYHARPVTNKVVYPPYWVKDDLEMYFTEGDPHVVTLAGRVIGTHSEPTF